MASLKNAFIYGDGSTLDMLVSHESLGRISFVTCSHRLAQYSTKAHANYENFKKLRAYPFRITPEAAQKTMARAAGPFCNNIGFLASLWAAIVPSNFFRPIRFSAAYFPAWIVNAEVEVDITYGDARRRGTVIFNNWYLSSNSTLHPPSDPYGAGSYVPGSHIPTLSAAPLWVNEFGREEPLPSIIQQSQLGDHLQKEPSESELQLFDPSLLKQHGEEVQCIPFTTSPFSLLDLARKLPWSDAVINPNLKFAPSSLKVNLFSAHPVLLPLYIAMYEIKRGALVQGSTLTMWTQAHPDWNTMTDNFAKKFHDKKTSDLIFKLFGFFSNSSADSEVFSYLRPDDQVKVGMISFPASKKASTAIEQWLQKALGSSTNISKLADTIDNDDDPRIRPMTNIERVALGRYFENESEILLIKRIIEDLKSAGPDVKVVTIGLSSQGSSSTERAYATLQARLDSLLAKKKELKPRWWTEWESIQSRESQS